MLIMTVRSLAVTADDYWSLTKWGLVFGNVITVLAGYALGAGGGPIDVGRFLAAAAGSCLVMMSGCVFNNYIDRDIDGFMARTKNRPLVGKRISASGALVFGAILGLAGFLTLASFTNIFAVGAAVVGFFFYVFMYSLWWKRRSVHGTLIGAVSGATPPVIGYAAAAGRIDLAAILLFFIMIAWQMPHFFAIAIQREDDYAAAHVPVMPVRRGVQRTKASMLIYIAGFTILVAALAVVARAPYLYGASVLGAAWFVFGWAGFRIADKEKSRAWARRMFLASLFVMIALFATIGIGAMVA